MPSAWYFWPSLVTRTTREFKFFKCFRAWQWVLFFVTLVPDDAKHLIKTHKKGCSWHCLLYAHMSGTWQVPHCNRVCSIWFHWSDFSSVFSAMTMNMSILFLMATSIFASFIYFALHVHPFTSDDHQYLVLTLQKYTVDLCIVLRTLPSHSRT